MSVFVTQVAVTGRLTAILFYDKEMVQLMVTIPKKFFIQYEDYINGAQSKLAVSKIDFARKITLNIMVLYFFTTIAMVFHPLLTIETEDDNATHSAGSHVLPFKSWYPLVPEHSPYYEIQYACQGALTIVEGLFLGTMDTLCIVVLLHYATQFQLLNESLRNMSNNVKEKIKLEGALRGFQDGESILPFLSNLKYHTELLIETELSTQYAEHKRGTTSETDNFLQKSDAIVQHTWNKSSEVLNLMNEAITEQISMTENSNDIIDLEGFVTEGSVKSYLDAEYLKYLKACIRHHQDLLDIRRPEFECSGPQLEGPEFECSGPQLEGPEFECSGPQLEGPEFEYSELSLEMDLDGLKIVRVALHLMCVIFQLWLFCWFGTNLTTQSADLFSAAYECSWYMQTPCFKHLLRLVILRAEKPVEITAGMLGSLSLPLFASHFYWYFHHEFMYNDRTYDISMQIFCVIIRWKSNGTEKNSLRRRDLNSGFQLYVLMLYPLSHTGYNSDAG
ncbi:hypothetical protein ANN_16265 [Periplaneta americana]|uniref:Odorant receptor n=1 Tax=Periplaneta americana TaxID=6978 RepID=A0ABQ8SIK0_PERAM|nr:hypothetical protein ANN_16265 [Periplaneta americana]